MSVFNFDTILKNDDIVKDYAVHLESIYDTIISDNDPTKTGDFTKLGPFPLLVSAGDGKVDIVHHLDAGNTNILLKTKQNLCAIIGIYDLGSPIEIKDLTSDPASRGKLPELEKIWDMMEESDMKTICHLKH